MEVLNSLLRFYSSLYISQKNVLEILAQNHNIVISRSTLQRKLKALKIHRRTNKTDILEIADYLLQKLDNFSSLHGYKWMHLKCLSDGFVVDRDTIRILLQILDKEGVELRKRRRLLRRRYYNHGPNFAWHIDSYDKLRPYGIFINGCIDGLSRLMIWLHASGGCMARSIARYFAKAVKCRNGSPRLVRTDMGVENGALHKMQIFLRRNHDDSRAANKSVVCGDSRANQRIESWWGILRKECAQFWMDLLKQIRDDGNFNGGDLDKQLIRFCFLDIIQADLDSTVEVWNKHHIRSTSTTGLPCDKPALLYTLPQLFGFTDKLCQADPIDIEVCEQETLEISNRLSCDQDLVDLCEILMTEYDWTRSVDPYETVSLYQSLRTSITELL